MTVHPDKDTFGNILVGHMFCAMLDTSTHWYKIDMVYAEMCHPDGDGGWRRSGRRRPFNPQEKAVEMNVEK